MTRFKFDRSEFSGALGDLGTLLPISIGMILVNGLDPCGLFLSIGLYYVLSGAYFGVTVPVQPMKVIGAYAIATATSAPQILASGALMGLALLIIGWTGAITVVGRYIPKSVVRGVQLSTGVLLVSEGIRFMLGTSKFQILHNAAEPFLTLQNVGFILVGIIIGVIGGIATLALLDNKKMPAGLFVIFGGIIIGLVFGTHENFNHFKFGFYLPQVLPFGLPSTADMAVVLLVLVLPQLPMTIGNAVIAYADLSNEYFGDDAKKVTYRKACLSMAAANGLSFLMGGMPLCHGAGGLAAHYRFGARTAGSNLIIGLIFTALALFLGPYALSAASLLPMAILGVLLVFAGSQLALTLNDIQSRKDLFVALLMLGITLASNLAVGFAVGLAVAYALKSERLTI